MFNQKFSFFWVVKVLCFCWCAGNSTMKSCVETDKQALLKLKDGFIDVSRSILSNWKTEVDCCQWSGVACNESTGHVIEINLEPHVFSKKLRGNISSSLCGLQHLMYLNLNLNNFEGSKIPECIGSLGQLRDFSIFDTSIGGTIPHGLQNLSNLQTLDLSFNNLIVNDLEWISHLSSLRFLDLSGINLSHVVDWPSSLSKAPHLSEISMDYCALMCHVNPTSFVHTTNSSNSIHFISLENNYLGSSILPWLSNISKVLTDLHLYGNTLGYIFPNSLNINSLKILGLGSNPLQLCPKAFSHMKSLKSLYLSSNSMQHIPSDAFSNTTSLELLDLRDNELENSMLKSISNLCQLKLLWLSDNKFSGKLSDWIPKLSKCAHNRIEELDLSDNPFSNGPFPKFSRFSRLVTLNLKNTSLHGSIPPNAFQHVPELAELHLTSNRLNSVINETHLSHLFNLRMLDVTQNFILFNFSSNWMPPFQLQVFSAPSCNLGPHFPRWLQYQTELDMLDISNASISDSIPQWLWLTSIHYLNISHNKLYGKLPTSFSIIDNYIWDLSFNNLSGPLPQFPPYAMSLLLSNNKFSGTTSFICATFQEILYYLDISSNVLSGRLPDCWEKLPLLGVLRLENNHFSGAIPDSVGTLNHLQSIHLNNNSLSGNLPSLMNSSEMLFIDFGHNNLSGKLPSWIGRYLPNLIGLSLQSNRFQGSIPTNLCNLSFLQILDLSKNNITGNIPHCFGNLSAMSNMSSLSPTISYSVGGSFSESLFMDTAKLSWKGEYVEYNKILGLVKTIDFSCNGLTGEIPSGITKLVALASLNLSRNHLQGSIPLMMGQMERLESLDLSHNSFSGEIPLSFSSLSFLSVLNLSFNNLYGKIPTGTQLQTFDASSYMGNQRLCGPPLIEVCPDQNPNIVHSIEADGDDSLISFGFYVSMALGFIFGFWGVYGTIILKSS